MGVRADVARSGLLSLALLARLSSRGLDVVGSRSRRVASSTAGIRDSRGHRRGRCTSATLGPAASTTHARRCRPAWARKSARIGRTRTPSGKGLFHVRHRGRGAGATLSGTGDRLANTTPNVRSPFPSRHASCASQHASGPPWVLQCSAQVPQSQQTRGAPHSQEKSSTLEG
jgi:hypothetical protein